MARTRKETSKQTYAAAPAIPSRFSGMDWLAVDIVAALFILFFTVPWQPIPEAPIGPFDFSWMVLLHDAFATARQFGREIILPQGPLGFIGNSVYDPRTYWVVIAARSAMSAVVFWSLREAARKLLKHAWAALFWMMGIILFIGRTPDHLFPACSILLILNYFEIHQRKIGRSTIGLIVVLAASSLIKVNQPFYAIAVVGVVTVDQIVQRQRNFFIAPLIYVGAFVIFYIAGRQSPANFCVFLWGWSQVALGHADAVGLPGPWIDPVCYLVIVALILGVIGYLQWKTRRAAGLLALAGVAAALLLLYKHSFMRQDKVHTQMAPLVALATILLYAPLVWRMANQRMQAACLIVISLSGTVAYSILWKYTGSTLLDAPREAMQQCEQNFSAAMGSLTDHTRLRREWEAERMRLREEKPLPLDKIFGTVDVYPHRQDIVFAYDLKYKPRPVVSSLVATSPILADVNARHLRGPNAPETILFDIELVDYNYPTLLDGESLPEILSRYDVVDSSGAMTVLHRASRPREYHLSPLLKTTVNFGDALTIPQPADGPVWARMHFKRRLAGKIVGALYKSPLAWITVHTNDGADNGYRLVPALAEQGFLLSPLIKDHAAFAQLAKKSWARDLKPEMVATLTITIEDGSQSLSFDPEIEVELSRLEFQHQD